MFFFFYLKRRSDDKDHYVEKEYKGLCIKTYINFTNPHQHTFRSKV